MSEFNIFQHPPLILTLWWYFKNIGVYRAQQQGYGHPLTIIHVQKMKKEAKPHGENHPSKKDKAQNLNNMSSIGIYIHLNELI